MKKKVLRKKMIEWAKLTLPSDYGICDIAYKTYFGVTYEDFGLLMGNKEKNNLSKNTRTNLFKLLFKAQLNCRVASAYIQFGHKDEKFLKFDALYVEAREERTILYELIKNIRYL